MKQFLLGVFVTVLLLGLMFAAYMYGKNGGFGTTPTTTQDTSATQMEEVVLATPVVIQDLTGPTENADPTTAIVQAVSSANYTPLLGLMAQSVTVRIERSGCCQPQNPQGAIAQLKYLENAKLQWIFSKTNPIVIALATSSPEYWGADFIVGFSSDKYAVSFGLNSENKIDTISMVVDYDLVINQ